MDDSSEKINCAVCGSGNAEPVSKRGHYGVPINVSICRDCGLVYLNPRWTKERYGRFYAEEYDKDCYKRDAAKEAVNPLRYGNAAVIFERLKKFLPETVGGILDVGAGMGWDLEYYGKQIAGAKLFAIEPAENCMENLAKSVGAELAARDAESDWCVTYENKIGLAVMRMTLEHLLDPVSALCKIGRALQDNGILYVAVPNMMRPKDKGSLENYWFRITHTYYYSEATLKALAAKAGFTSVVVNSETAELWGIFKKGNQDCVRQPVYAEQKKAIADFRRKYLLKSLLPTADNLKRFLPASARVFIKKIFS
jgi:SAM-dependent methyltransferase